MGENIFKIITFVPGHPVCMPGNDPHLDFSTEAKVKAVVEMSAFLVVRLC
jgi:hypothetical protein